ncbi:KxYKxGKxW signal peptide domain-containing protein [Streptococcus hillyeri]|uniref:LPXTG cell wall anchor domain-containing protein n=1 Tax=Streptococcus hillyeri TaxID=2282420 RepID=A0A3L9DW40_9STRE|nr:alpha-amylase family glycosyl hydrolase [Streptococcus hillyeri]RLY04468.1 LPXTG cell wall anchor domain-containing protein [Streptococcus hillyeri]
MSKKNKFVDKKVTGFRMWKSGKKWLFGASVLTAISFAIGMQTVSANDAAVDSITIDQSQPSAVEVSNASAGQEEPVTSVSETETIPAVSSQSDSEVTGIEITPKDNSREGNSAPVSEEESTPKPRTARSVSTTESVEAPEEVTIEQFVEKKPVTIHFETDAQGPYGVWTWESGPDGKFTPMAFNGSKHEATLQANKDKTYINYIVAKAKDNGEPDWNNKQTSNMVATVNEFADTHVYIGKDKKNNQGVSQSWYSQVSAQDPKFDETYAYIDKIVNPNKPDNFETVGKAGRLGATLNEDGKTAKINLWAPTAKTVKVNFYQSSTDPKSDKLATVAMTRGTDVDSSDYKNNTIGVWSLEINEAFLKQYKLETAEMLSYDYELEIPNAYFIQAEEHKKEVSTGKWERAYYKYRNSVTGELLNGPDYQVGKETKKTILGDNEAKWEEIAAFYASGKIERDDKGEIVPQKQVYQTVKTQDPYSVGVVQNGSRSVILNPSKYGSKVTQGNAKRVSSLSELSVMEIDVRDFSIDPKSGVDKEKRGNFLGLIQEGTKNGNQMTGLDYLKYTGVKYVQVMPVNDFQTVPELDKGDEKDSEIAGAEEDGVHNNQQNWGYDPKNYNVPDGSYSSDPSKPEVRIQELKEMINGLHKAGINVVLDVVYNHLYHGQENPFEWTVPGYYYAVNGDGAMNNDVGVGNAVRSNSRMLRQFIVNSVVYWATEYGIDGFRFDAMSDLDTKTLSDVRTALDKIDKKIVTYGEGWDSMGNYLKGEGDEVKASIGNAIKLPEYGFFDATGRDAIAGSQYNDNGGAKGFVNSESNYKTNNNKDKQLDQVTKSLLGGLDQKYANPSQQLNYVEVHDGKTLYDLLKKYNESDDDAKLKNRVQLATAMSALSQGIHFSQMGQEFARTKNHKHNTYNAGDVYNKIDWELVGKNPDMVNFYKALVAFRTQEPLMHLTDYKDINGKDNRTPKMVITNAQDNSGIITYELRGDKGGKYVVVFNNNTSPDHGGRLTLGGQESWYYGGKLDQQPLNPEGNRGQINEKNDFTNAFVVLSNSKGLYDKIGQTVGTETVTLDHLSATIFYIPAEPKLSEIKTSKQTITYVDKKGTPLTDVPAKERKVSFVTVTKQDPNFKFTFEKSQLTTKENDLGHKQNILTGLRDNAEVTYAYYAEDLNGNPVEVSEKPSLDAKGVPVSESKNIIWKLASEAGGFVKGATDSQLPMGYTNNENEWLNKIRYYLTSVSHPNVKGYKVVDISPESSGDLNEVKILPLSIVNNQDIKVTYAKQSRAIIVSKADPENDLQDVDKVPSYGYFVDGYDGKDIVFDDKLIKLDRLGYTYTVNGKSTLAEAVAATPNFGEENRVFEVLYTPNDAKVKVEFIDVDNGNAVVAHNEIAGKVGEQFKVTTTTDLVDKAKYDILEGQFDKEKLHYFDKVDDTDAISQVIKVMLAHKHEIRQIETINRVIYKGVPNQHPKETVVTWTVDKDLVTNVVTYKPHQDKTVIETPEIENYHADEKSIVFENSTGVVQPMDQTKEVVYKAIKPLMTLTPAFIPMKKLTPATVPMKELEPSFRPLTPLTPATVPMKELEPSFRPLMPLTPATVPMKELEPSFRPLTKLTPATVPMKELEPSFRPLTPLTPATVPMKELEPSFRPLTKLTPATVPMKELEPSFRPLTPLTPATVPMKELEPSFRPLTKLTPATVPMKELEPAFRPLTKLEPAQRIETLKVEALIQPEKPELFLPEDFKSETLSQLSESKGPLSNTSEVEVLVQSEILSENSRNSDITVMSLEVTNSAKSSLSSKEDTSVLLPKTGEEEQLYLTMLGGLLFTLAMAGVGISDKSKKVND